MDSIQITPLAQDIPASSFAEAWTDVLEFNHFFAGSTSKWLKDLGLRGLPAEIYRVPTRRQTATHSSWRSRGSPSSKAVAFWNDVFSAANETNPCFLSLYDQPPNQSRLNHLLSSATHVLQASHPAIIHKAVISPHLQRKPLI